MRTAAAGKGFGGATKQDPAPGGGKGSKQPKQKIIGVEVRGRVVQAAGWLGRALHSCTVCGALPTHTILTQRRALVAHK